MRQPAWIPLPLGWIAGSDEAVWYPPISHDACPPHIARLEVAALTDPGCWHTINEDSAFFDTPVDGVLAEARGSLLVVAGNSQGTAAGEMASSLMVDVIRRRYYSDPGEPTEALRAAARAAAEAAQTNVRTGAEPAFAAVAVAGLRAHVLVSGGCRVHVVRGGRVHRLTGNPIRQVAHAANSWLGLSTTVRPSAPLRPLPLLPLDRLVLCTRGLFAALAEKDALRIAGEGPPAEACGNLVRLARERGAPDNLTVGIALVPGDSAEKLNGPVRRHIGRT